MAFTVEDGTGVAGANSLCSVAVADAYFADRGETAWTGTSSAKQVALIQATDYIQLRWAAKLQGSPVDVDQALCFPRTGITNVADNTVPTKVQHACAEYALRALSGKLLPDPTPDTGGRVVSEKTTRVGPLETTTKYQQHTPLQIGKDYPVPDSMMRVFSNFYGGGVIRA